MQLIIAIVFSLVHTENEVLCVLDFVQKRGKKKDLFIVLTNLLYFFPVSFTAIREMKILQDIHHENVIGVSSLISLSLCSCCFS